MPIILGLFNAVPIRWLEYGDCVAYWPLTELSCSNCVNRNTAIRQECKQIERVNSRKRVMWVDNRKRLGVVKWYMQTPTTITASLAISLSHADTASDRRVQRRGQSPPRPKSWSAKWGPEYGSTARLRVKIVVLRQLSRPSVSVSLSHLQTFVPFEK